MTLSGTAGATTAVVTQIAPMNGTTFNVAVSGMTGDGTVIADIGAGTATDLAGNATAASTSSDNMVNFISAPPIITEGASVAVTMSQNSTPTPFSLTLNATDANGDPLTWSILTPATHGTAGAAAGPANASAISYTPLANYYGADTFVVQVSDGALTDSITVNVTIVRGTFTLFLPVMRLTGTPDLVVTGYQPGSQQERVRGRRAGRGARDGDQPGQRGRRRRSGSTCISTRPARRRPRTRSGTRAAA